MMTHAPPPLPRELASLPGRQTALVIVNCQNEHSRGPSPVADFDRIAANINRLKSALCRREVGATAVFVRTILPSDSQMYAEGSANAELSAEVGRGEGDEVVTSSSLDIFEGGQLGKLLQERGIKTLLFAGFQTHVSVAPAAREASSLGYRVGVVRDAVGDHEFDVLTALVAKDVALRELEPHAAVLTTEEVLQLPAA